MPPARQTKAALLSLQRLMARAVMRPLDANARTRLRWSDGTSTKSVAASFIKPGPHLNSFDRLQIYNRQYWSRVFDCLADDYPGVRSVLGETKFRNLAVAYLATHPSTRYTLRDLGRSLPAFILGEPRWTTPRTVLAADMARLEWSHIEAFDNEAKPPLTQADLVGRDPSKIHLRLQPHITLLQLQWPLDEYLLALRDSPRLRAEASNAVVPSDRKPRPKKVPLPKPAKVHLAVHRYQNVVYYKRLTSDQFGLLTEFRKASSLLRALNTLPAPATDAAVRDWFQDWSTLGWFWIA